MHDVGTRTPACSAAVKRETPTGASIRHPLTVSVAGMKFGDLPVGSALEFELDSVRDFGRRALALLRLAPSPLREIVVGGLQPTRGGKSIDALHESRVHRERHVVELVLCFDLRRDFLPVKNCIAGHCQACLASRRKRSTAADAF